MRAKKTIIGFLMAIAIYSCTEKMSIDLDSSDSKLIVSGSITTDTMSHKVKLTQSVPFYSNENPRPVSHATVYIVENQTNRIDLMEDPQNPGSYFTPDSIYGKSGATYRLYIENVNINGVISFQAEAQMPELLPDYQTKYLDSITVSYNANWKGWVVNGWAKEPVEMRNYYLFRVRINDVLYSDSLEKFVLVEDKLFNGITLQALPFTLSTPRKFLILEIR